MMSEIQNTKTKIRQINGIKQIMGIRFSMVDGIWTCHFCEGLKMTVTSTNEGKECFLYDERDGSVFQFKTVFAAKSFAKRRRHGRSIEEHSRAEALQTAKEKNGWSVKDVGEKFDVSPRTVEAWFSGCRVVPVSVEVETQ